MPRAVSYILRIEGPSYGGIRADVAEILTGRVLGDAEDIINDALPEGFYCKIDEVHLSETFPPEPDGIEDGRSIPASR